MDAELDALRVAVSIDITVRDKVLDFPANDASSRVWLCIHSRLYRFEICHNIKVLCDVSSS
jgi:hypothetical protein